MQNVLSLAKSVAHGGRPAGMEITGDGIDVVAEAYHTSMGKMATMAIEQKMSLHEAEHGGLPETHEEFITKMIEPVSPSGLQLPMPPYYREYAYEPRKKAVAVIDFPAKKERRHRETTGAAGL